MRNGQDTTLPSDMTETTSQFDSRQPMGPLHRSLCCLLRPSIPTPCHSYPALNPPLEFHYFYGNNHNMLLC